MNDNEITTAADGATGAREAAKAEALRRWPLRWASASDEAWGREPLVEVEREAFMEGAEWARREDADAAKDQEALIRILAARRQGAPTITAEQAAALAWLRSELCGGPYEKIGGWTHALPARARDAIRVLIGVQP